jgi:hypothetical protein
MASHDFAGKFFCFNWGIRRVFLFIAGFTVVVAAALLIASPKIKKNLI